MAPCRHQHPSFQGNRGAEGAPKGPQWSKGSCTDGSYYTVYQHQLHQLYQRL